jgi:tetratricopeptide (TPR) repeat protein
MSSSNFLSKFSRLSTMFSNNKEISNNDDKYKDNDYDYYRLAIFHQFFTFKNNLTKKYYNLCIKNNINKSDSLNNLGYYYVTQEKNYDLAKQHYLESIELKNIHAMNNLGMYYYSIEKNYIEAKKYYQMASDNALLEAYNNLGLYYYEIDNNVDIAKMYFAEALYLSNNDIYSSNQIKINLKIILSPIERYILYQQNNIVATREEDDEFNKDKNVIIFKNRYNLFAKFIECCICLNEYCNIPLECTHYICVDCYPKIIKSAKCPLCRIKINS